MSARQHLRERVGDVAARDGLTLLVGVDRHLARGRVIGEHSGADDGPVEVASTQVGIRAALGVEVDLEDTGVDVLRRVGADRRHHDVASHARLLRGVGEQHRSHEVDAPLARPTRFRAATRGEDDGVAAVDDLGDVVDRGVLE